ncbi:MAG: permease [Gammaproteobacteria bacterium]
MAVHVLALVGAGLREAFFMFWATLWALVLGFGLSGAVQAFVSRNEMQRTLGDARPVSLGRAAFFGMVSSSCSYAASAMAKSLFQRGANFTAAMVFMFASTNLVIELGLVLWILMGWQFAVSEYIGGIIMIVFFVLASRLVLTPAAIRAARRRLGEGDAGSENAETNADWCKRLRSKAGWADAASYALADLRMLAKEMAIGYVIAGFLAALVPRSAWATIFLHGHGFWTTLENAVVGPFIAVLTFVCSVGNVPLAAALWQGGIGFGGVVSFIFADLITLPLILIYRKFYGGRLTLRLVALFWAVMSATGLAVEYLFTALGWIPSGRSAQIVLTTFAWNYTTFLNIVFIGVFALLWWLARNQWRLGGGAGYALDPVCGMQVQTANAPATARHAGETWYFCSDRCRTRFIEAPDGFANKVGP